MAITVTATEGGSTFNGIHLTVVVLPTAAATQNGASNSTNANNPTALAITPNATGSRVYGAMVNPASATVFTANGSTTFLHTLGDATNGASYASHKSTATTTAATPVTLGSSAPAVAGGIAQAEILTPGSEDASGGSNSNTAGITTNFTFTPPAGSLLVALVSSDGGAAACTMTVSGGGLTWTEVVKANASGSGYAGVWTARVAAAAAGIPPTAPVHRRMIPAKVVGRQRVATPVPAQVVVPPPPYPPLSVRAKWRTVEIRRGHAAAPAPAQVVITPPTYPPQSVRTRLRGLRLFRGHAAIPVPAQVVVTPPAYPPTSVRTRIKGLRLFRPHTATPVPAQVVVAPPAYMPGRARQAVVREATARRGHAVTPPAPQLAPPVVERIKLRMARIFRGKPAVVVPPQVVIVPPAYPPLPARGKKRMWSLRRRRAGLEGRMVGAAANPCITPRPSTGTTSRSGSGVTAYNTATTSRPSTGTTTRPDSGSTPDPC